MLMGRRIRFSVASTFIAGVFVGMILYDISKTRFFNSKGYNENDEDDRYPLSRSVIRNPVYTSSGIYVRYLNEYATEVDGWINREIFYVVWVVSQYQYEHLNVFGGIGEIGVHHGKFTCFLYLLRRYQEQNLFAVDVFDNQALNKDGSGLGQKDVFFKNIREYAQIFKNEVAIYSGSSLDLNPIFFVNEKAISWWQDQVVGGRGLQLVSVGFS
jgi:hypothetical protein